MPLLRLRFLSAKPRHSGTIAGVDYYARMSANGCSLPDQTPTSRKSWAVRGADKNVIVEIPYRCLTGCRPR